MYLKFTFKTYLIFLFLVGVQLVLPTSTQASVRTSNTTESATAGSTVVIETTPAEVLVENITQWHDCVAKGTQLIDMAHNGSYILFNVQSTNGGYFTFSSDIATSLNDIACILGTLDSNGDFADADTNAIANTGGWTNTENYQWLFYLEADSVYSFKMQCIAGSGYALNAFNIVITDFEADVTLQEMDVNGFSVIPDADAYTTESYFDEDITVTATPNSNTANATYSATVNDTPVAITNGIISKADFSNGDVIKVTARIADGATDYADYLVEITVTENKKQQLLGAAEEIGYWTAIENSSANMWTDYIYTLRPSPLSASFAKTSWIAADGASRYGMKAGSDTVAIEIPSYFQVQSVSFVGYGAATLGLNSEGATVTAPATPSFDASATGAQPDELTFALSNHVAGTPLIFNVSNTTCRMYIVLSYTEVADVSAPELVSQNINNDDELSVINGIFSLRFNEEIRLTESASATLDGQSVKLKAEDNVFVKHYFHGLAYNSSHTFHIAANSIEDVSGNAYASDIDITFTTGEKVAVVKKVYDFIVGVDGSIDDAIEAANAAPGSDRYYIFVPHGNYELSGNDADHMTNITRSNISIIGQSIDSSIISNTPESYGISTTATLHLKYVSNIYMEDITLKNNRGVSGAGQQVTLFDRGTKNIFKSVKMYSFQDTYVTGDRSYHETCKIYGATDYICGGGDCFFDSCLMYNVASDGNKVTAPAQSPDQKWGYVFTNCTINGGGYVLGRPWKDEPKAYFLYTKLNRQPNGTGWEGMGGVETYFYEYKSMNLDGDLLDLSGRGNSPTSTNKYDPILSDDEAEEFTLYNVVGGTDGYMPSDYTVQLAAPELTIAGELLSWKDNPDAMCAVIFKDGEFVECTTSNEITLTEIGFYTVQLANEMGGLGEPVTIGFGVSSLHSSFLSDDEENTYPEGIYDITGRRLNRIPDSGIYIKNGKKYFIH